MDSQAAKRGYRSVLLVDGMDAKACKDLGGKEVPNKAMCAL